MIVDNINKLVVGSIGKKLGAELGLELKLGTKPNLNFENEVRNKFGLIISEHLDEDLVSSLDYNI